MSSALVSSDNPADWAPLSFNSFLTRFCVIDYAGLIQRSLREAEGRSGISALLSRSH